MALQIFLNLVSQNAQRSLATNNDRRENSIKQVALGLDQLSVNAQEGARAAEGEIETLIDEVFETRSRNAVGAERLAHTIAQLDRTLEENVRADSIISHADLG